jgi:hypothetical protein
MYAWRPNSDPETFQSLFDHLENCDDCAREFDLLSSRDEAVRRAFQKVPENSLLESRILAGLAHERANAMASRARWRTWFLIPITVAILLVVAINLVPRLHQQRLGREVEALLSAPPALQINSTDRNEILRWSADVLPGLASLPPQLNRVEFSGAAVVRVDDHKAVLLKMKNERRASLLILDARLTDRGGIKPMQERIGCAALWSDQERTYVLLFDGSMQDLRSYMDDMGIGA